MKNLIEAARAALEALVWEAGSEPSLYATQTGRAIDALRTALAEAEKSPGDRARAHADRICGAAEAEKAQPYLHVYEYHSAIGLHREFYPREWNGMQPDRVVPLYASPPPQPVAVPAGWKLVPVELTRDMRAAGIVNMNYSVCTPDQVWVAMLAAVPASPAAPAQPDSPEA